MFFQIQGITVYAVKGTATLTNPSVMNEKHDHTAPAEESSWFSLKIIC